MKAVAVLLLAMLACCHGFAILPAASFNYGGAVVYSKPKVKNIEIKTPVITKTNLNVVTDKDEISTTEIKPFAPFAYAGYGNRFFF